MTNPVTKCSLYALAVLGVLFSSSLFYAQESGFNLVFYSTRDGAANSQIYAMNSDGSHQMRLTNDTANDTDPDISPTGNQIVFTVRPTPTSNTNIFLRDQHGAVRNLTNSTSNNGWARWSPDGRHIAFESDRDGGVYEIYVMDLKYPQDLPRQVTYPPTPSRFPSWSPHGRYIVLRHGIDVAVVNAGGGTPIPLTQEASTSFAQMASWSPNGNYIAFMSFRNGYCSVFRMDADGNNQIELTPNPDPAHQTWCSRAPAWSSEGERILFMSARPSTLGQNQIFVMRPDGSHLHQLTTDGANGSPRAHLDE